MPLRPPPRGAVARSRAALPGQAFVPGWAFVLAVAAEWRRATAAAHRYEQLKREGARTRRP